MVAKNKGRGEGRGRNRIDPSPPLNYTSDEIWCIIAFYSNQLLFQNSICFSEMYVEINCHLQILFVSLIYLLFLSFFILTRYSFLCFFILTGTFFLSNLLYAYTEQNFLDIPLFLNLMYYIFLPTHVYY